MTALMGATADMTRVGAANKPANVMREEPHNGGKWLFRTLRLEITTGQVVEKGPNFSGEARTYRDIELNVYAGKPIETHLRYTDARWATSASWPSSNNIASELNHTT